MPSIPLSEGVKYIGSKRKLLSSILEIISRTKSKSVLDVFSGTTRVGQSLRSNGFVVGSNDVASYSKVFGRCYLETSRVNIKDHLLYLNNLSGKEGFLTCHYSGGSFSKGKENPIMYWQRKNTLKADRIREEIDKISTPWSKTWCVLVTSLIRALDAVDNTVGVQQAFLKNKWSKRSYNDLFLVSPKIPRGPKGKVYQQDSNSLVKKVSKDYDLVYLDPPYTSHNYISYYHIWETLVRNDNPEVSGIVNRRVGIPASAYNKKVGALSSLEDLLNNIQSKYILLSYNNEGIINSKDILKICQEKTNKINVLEVDYKRNVMSQIGIHNKDGIKVGNPGQKRNIEYLIFLTL